MDSSAAKLTCADTLVAIARAPVVIMDLLMRAIYLGLCVAALAGAAAGQDFPAKPLRLVVPWPPSGNVDITARTVAPAIAEALGQQVVGENRAGALGMIVT